MQSVKFYLVADPHYFKNSLGARGEQYDDFMHYEQKCFAETQAINEAAFDFLEKDEQAEYVLFAGDLSFNGEKESHLAFIEHLRRLEKAGKKVLVITADHDFKEKREDCFAYDENGLSHPLNTHRDELFDLYYDFGFKDAIAVDKQHLSYVYQLSDGVRLLALNNDGPDGGGRFFDDGHREWIKEQCDKAKEDNQIMFAMNHYPLIPGQPVFNLISSSRQKDAKDVINLLADNGVHLCFTGHMHNQAINLVTTDAGNRFYDVCTGSLIADPSVIRIVDIINEHKVDIKTIDAPDFEWDTKGRTCKEYLSDMFDNMISNVLYDMAYDTDRMMNKFHIDKKMKPLIKMIGKFINSLTVGGAGRLLHFKVDESIKKTKVKDIATELVRMIFVGNQYMKEGTPKGDAVLALFRRLNFVFKKINVHDILGRELDMQDVLKNTVGNYDIDDYNAVIEF